MSLRSTLPPLSRALSYVRSDSYALRAQQENLRTRAAYKLDEINSRFKNFLSRGANVVDLGAAPGGFSLIAARNINIDQQDRWDNDDGTPPILGELRRTLAGRRRKFGKLVCVDLCDMPPIDGATFINGDIQDPCTTSRILRALRFEEADVVLSDIAPATTGDAGTNHVRSMELAGHVLESTRRLLRNGGTLCVKVFQGSEEEEFKQALKNEFVKVKAFRPKACRKGSREVYFVASGFVPEDLVGLGSDDIYEEIDAEEQRTVAKEKLIVDASSEVRGHASTSHLLQYIIYSPSVERNLKKKEKGEADEELDEFLKKKPSKQQDEHLSAKTKMEVNEKV